MEELQVKRIQEHENQERHILENIGVRMGRIEATQQKKREGMLKEPKNHHDGKTTWISGSITTVTILLQQNIMEEIKLLLYITASGNRFSFYL